MVVARRRRRQAAPQRFADRLDADLAFIDKRRPKGTHNVAVATEVVGEIDGPHVRASSTT